ncbi:TPA: hypothetical protein N0F65_005094, partial [Lagenidium giganteum]
TFSQFVPKLAYQLILNDYYSERTKRKRQEEANYESVLPMHALKPFIDRPHYKEARKENSRAQRQCKICHTKSSFFCSTCSRPKDVFFFPLCGPGTGSDCLSKQLSLSL